MDYHSLCHDRPDHKCYLHMYGLLHFPGSKPYIEETKNYWSQAMMDKRQHVSPYQSHPKAYPLSSEFSKSSRQ